MADKKVSDLTELTQADGEDLLLIVSDPVGAPASRKITVNDFFSNVSVVTAHTANVVFESGVSFTGSLELDNETTFNNGTTFDGVVTIQNTLNLNSNVVTDSNSTITINNVLNSNGTLTVTGNADFSSGINATGNTSIQNLQVLQKLTVSANTFSVAKYGDPTSANATNEGVTAGSIFFSDDFLYIAIDENTLKRVALSDFSI
jgi:hypothetical protein